MPDDVHALCRGAFRALQRCGVMPHPWLTPIGRASPSRNVVTSSAAPPLAAHLLESSSCRRPSLSCTTSWLWSSQDLVETLSARLVSRFELLWTYSAEMTVTARSIVEGIDILGHISDRELSVLVDLFLDSLFLQA